MTAPRHAKKCSVEGCQRRQHSRQLCRMHYGRLWRYGDVGQVHALANRKNAEVADVRRDLGPQKGIEQDLRQARAAYKLACGIACRVHWAHEVRKLERELSEAKRKGQA